MNTDLQKQINTMNEYFDFIYVLTIERAKDRQEKIKKDLKGLNYSFFYGADKKDLDLKKLEEEEIYSPQGAKFQNRYNKEMTLGEIACSIGHKHIYEDVIKNGYEKALIMEDDVVFNFDEIANFSHLAEELPSNWELLYFDYAKHEKRSIRSIFKIYTYHIQKMLGGLKWSHTMIRNLYPRKHSKYLHKSGYHYFASAYAITQSAAEKLIELQTPIQFPADHLLPYAVTNEIINGFITTNKLFNQQSQGNSINMQSYIS